MGRELETTMLRTMQMDAGFLTGLIIKIYSCLLGVTADNPTGFVASKRAIGVQFMLENPFASYNIGTRWARQQRPSVVVYKGSVRVSHGLANMDLTAQHGMSWVLVSHG